MTRLMSPILVFTSDEVWQYLPKGSKREESVHLSQFPDFDPSRQQPDLADRWEKLSEIRGEVSKCVEKARAKKEIGHPLDAEVSLLTDNDELYAFLSQHQDIIKTILIVSSVKITREDPASQPEAYANSDVEGLGIIISKAPGEKCERCWQYSTTVGEDHTHPTLCKRCRIVIS